MVKDHFIQIQYILKNGQCIMPKKEIIQRDYMLNDEVFDVCYYDDKQKLIERIYEKRYITYTNTEGNTITIPWENIERVEFIDSTEIKKCKGE